MPNETSPFIGPDHYYDYAEPKQEYELKLCLVCREEKPARRFSKTVNFGEAEFFTKTVVSLNGKKVTGPICYSCLKKLQKTGTCFRCYCFFADESNKKRLFIKSQVRYTYQYCPECYKKEVFTCKRCKHKNIGSADRKQLCSQCSVITKKEVKSKSYSLTKKIKRRFGIEFELFNLKTKAEYELLKLNDSKPPSPFIIGRDSSIYPSDRAREIRTVIFSGNKGVDLIKKLCEILKNNCSVNRTCGLHVHVDATDLSDKEFINLLSFVGIFDPVYFSLTHPYRISHHYCRQIRSDFNSDSLKKSYSPNQALNILGNSKYRGFNASPFFSYGSVEFRYHEGCTDYKEVYNWLILCLKTVEIGSRQFWNKKDFPTNLTALRAKLFEILELTEDESNYWESIRTFTNWDDN